MKRYRASLPPLDTLVFFEAAYRRKSFTAGAGELNVSQAAVSKRIWQLEAWIGEALFVREGKRLVPTPLGDKLFQTTSMTLEFLQRGLGALREEAHRPLSIGANTAVGMFWLTPHLRAFGLSAEACPTRLITSDNPQDLFNGGNDLTVTYGDGTLADRTTTLLFPEKLTPVAAPQIAALFGNSLRSIQDVPPAVRPKLLNYERASPDWVDWRVWFHRLSFGNFDAWPVETLSTYSQTIGEAIDGRGIALGSIWLLGAELQAGVLQRVSRDVLLSGRGYYVSYANRTVLSAGARHLINHLMEAARLAHHEQHV
jgi:LysR family glycine cleavage system transcriptional activator